MLIHAGLILFGLLTAGIAGLVGWLLVGPVVGVIVAVGVLALTIWATRLPTTPRRLAGTGVAVILLAALGLMTVQVLAVMRALSDRSGPVAQADPGHLASANDKIDDVAATAGFRLELDEDELTALVQQGLVEADTALASVAFDVDEQNGVVEFSGEFRSGDLSMNGAVAVGVELGAVTVDLVAADLGDMTVPGALTDAIDDIVAGLADFQGALVGSGASVQSVEYTETSLILIGTSRSGAILTSQDLLDGLAENIASLSGAVEPPPERLGPGRVNGASAEGATYYVALGDSLAANVGVDEARDGYVSRFHSEVERSDDVTYGLRNFGVSGETSGSLLNGGQLDEAVAFLESNAISYVTIDIGANDLLGHLGSEDCGNDFNSVACQDRIQDSLSSYAATLAVILDRIITAAPDATVVFLQTYNPFSLGMESFVEFEQDSNDAVRALNQTAAMVAEPRGVLLADGFTPMEGTTSVTTHMTDNPPDIHPTAIGFDILAVALVEALE